MRTSFITVLSLFAIIAFTACNRQKVPAAAEVPAAWLTFTDQKSGNINFPIEQISAEWVGREFSVAIATSDGRMLQIQQLQTDSLPGFYEGGTFQMVYMPGNFQAPCISTLTKKNTLEVIKTEKGYSLLLNGGFDCPDFNYRVTGALPIAKPASPQRTTYPITR